tara:strand:+ start:464 stop:1003 length:540 start_codon:yes stop_codon:yes gene_type:complete
MSDVRIIVDHIKLDYQGLFKLNDFFKTIDAWLFERGLEKRTNKNFEQNTPKGKFIEWEIASWKKITPYVRYIYKLRVLIYGLKKVEVAKDKENLQLDNGHILIYFDGYIEFDYEHRWDETPILVFLRTLYDKFIYKVYTERFENRLTYDLHQLYDVIERFLNMYRHYRPVSRVPHFAGT